MNFSRKLQGSHPRDAVALGRLISSRGVAWVGEAHGRALSTSQQLHWVVEVAARCLCLEQQLGSMPRAVPFNAMCLYLLIFRIFSLVPICLFPQAMEIIFTSGETC